MCQRHQRLPLTLTQNGPCYALWTHALWGRSSTASSAEPDRELGGARFVSEMRVLIVDDEEDMRALVRATIEIANEGLTVAAEAPDGETAVDLVRTEHPEVVVLDHRMPGTSGLETARRILAE